MAFQPMNNQISEKQALLNKYNGARTNLLLVVLFTALNIILLVTGSYTYFLFSATVPYLLVDTGLVYSGMYPEEYYEGYYDEFAIFDESFFAVMLVLALATVAIYVLSWLLSKKQRVGWLILALVFFILDTVVMFMFYGISFDMAIDIVFHAWVIYYLVTGIVAHKKLKAIEAQEELMPIVEVGEPPEGYTPGEATAELSGSKTANSEDGSVREEEAEGDSQKPDSQPIRTADTEGKVRILLELDAFNHTIVYRRVKKCNELVIDGNVYDEYEAMWEKAHMLTATLDGHDFAVGFDGNGLSYAAIDGEIVKKKVRLI